MRRLNSFRHQLAARCCIASVVTEGFKMTFNCSSSFLFCVRVNDAAHVCNYEVFGRITSSHFVCSHLTQSKLGNLGLQDDPELSCRRLLPSQRQHRIPCIQLRIQGLSQWWGRAPAWHISTRFRNVGTVGTRSRAIRGSTSDDRVGCSASEGRYAPARPAWHVSPRLSPFLPCALASADCLWPFPIIAPSVNVLGRTRRKPSTITERHRPNDHRI